jgi:short-subunit dehydrogenase
MDFKNFNERFQENRNLQIHLYFVCHCGFQNLADYSATKYGVAGFTEVLHYEIIFSGYTGVHTTLVCPSFVKTKLFDGCKYRYGVSFRLGQVAEVC